MTANQTVAHISLEGNSKGDFCATKKGHSGFHLKLIQFYLTIHIIFIIDIVSLEFEFFL